MADNRISSSKREIYTKFLDVMEKYDSDLENDDYAKTGLVGWLFEINAMMMRDSTYHKTVLYNEHFLNTAQIPKTVYNYAKMFNVEIEKATPAYADANIIIPRTEAEAIATTNANNRIVLNRDDQIYAGDYEFALEHSIEIHYDENTKMFTARYMTPAEEGKTTTFQQLNNYSINIRSDGENIIIPVRLFQYRINKYNTQIITNTFLNKIQTYKFEDQFCGIRLFSQKNKELVNIPVVYSELDNTESNYALYNLDDEHELELIFKEGDEYFTPAPNSNIIVYIYTTKGENVPKQFAGDAVMQISNTDLKTLPLVIQFNPTDIIGGVNSASITKLKQKIINEISISHTIVTQADLDDYFNKIITVINEINDGNIKFIKRRDDIIRRIFDSYLLLRDRTDDSVNSIKIKSDNKYISPCVPTNSVDVLINTNNLLSANGIINLINPKFSISNEATVDNEIYNYTIETSTNPAEYICPFNMYIYNKDFQFVKYIYTAVDSSSEVYFANDNNSIYITDALASERWANYNINNPYAIPLNVRLRRSFNNNNGNNSFSTTKYYFLDISFTTNFSTEEIPEELYAWSNSTTEAPHIILSGLKSNGKFKPTSFTSEDLGNGMYKTTVSFILNCSDNEFTILDSTNDKGDFNFIQIVDNNDNTCLFGSDEVISITFNNIFYKDATTIKATDDLKFFISLDNIMSSELSIDENNVIKINKLPVVHTSFFKSSNLEERKEGFIQQLFTYINKLQESSDLLETSTNFNLKFFNTYGSSHLYNTPTTNLKIDMEIVLNEDYVNNTELQNEIRSYIRRLVDVMNTNLGYIDLYKIITILYDTEVYGNYIKNIRYAAGSESLIATIDPIKFKDEKDKEQYVPEWLNLDAEYLTTGITFK